MDQNSGNSDQKPREFWIEKSSLGIFNAVEDKAKLNGWKQDNGPIHVIEKSAYDQVNELLAGNMCGYCDRKMHEQDGFDLHKEIIRGDELFQMAQKLRADLDLAIEALKWCFPRATHGVDHGCHKCVGITQISDGVYICPYHKSEETLAKLGKHES